ncbi:hypothetical protein [Baaleninema simplex]|uniref:hypothetical protein n=1 Tax=Baaleninema simplex TaxID=2862350 RepID=UPI0003469075|nr:hypothetical protein [Baaleninema simplex]
MDCFAGDRASEYSDGKRWGKSISHAIAGDTMLYCTSRSNETPSTSKEPSASGAIAAIGDKLFTNSRT